MTVGISGAARVGGVRDRATLITYGLLLLVTVGAWVHVMTAMPAGDMAGMDMVMAPTLADGALYVVAWAAMMTAMMLPSALPMIGDRAHGGEPRGDGGTGGALRPDVSGSRVHAFGIDGDETSGRNNGHFAPFSWRSSSISGASGV